MSDELLQSLAWGGGVAALAFAFLLSWRTLRRARRSAFNRSKEAEERQPEHRQRLARRLGCGVDELPELGGWKITPDFACLLAEIVDDARPARVLELGSGSSTVLLARLLAPSGATLTSLEQDAAHADLTRKMIAATPAAGGARTHVAHAPVAPWKDAREGDAPWYSEAALAALPPGHEGPWDLVVVDGPSTQGRADARFPALPRLLARLSPRAIVVLDDAARPGERAVVAAWKGLGLLSGFDAEEIPLARGAVILRRRD